MALLDSIRNLFSKAPRLNVQTQFALLREAIQGTMSSFYMARDLRNDRIVGLKILDREKTAAFEGRFKDIHKPSEGEIALSMQHPRVVKTFEYGLTTDENPYVIMEFLQGPNFSSLIIGRDGRLKGRCVHFIRQTAEALAYVHESGFLHRDMCPRNLMLSDEGRNLKLIDFGLSVPATKSFFQPGNRTGTANYMAPELVRRRWTDQRVDIFAFGATAYEICTGELPWARGDTGLAAMGHDQEPHDILDYRPKLHPELAQAIHACIEPNLAKRCPSMVEFLQMISDVQSDEV